MSLAPAQAGFIGTLCESTVNLCAADEKYSCPKNSVCDHLGPGKHRCRCHVGYKASNGVCKEVNECDAKPCKNNATCVDRLNSYYCRCAPGFKFDNCGEEVNECYSAPCKHGSTCVDQVNSYRCSCVAGFTSGVLNVCEIDTDECFGWTGLAGNSQGSHTTYLFGTETMEVTSQSMKGEWYTSQRTALLYNCTPHRLSASAPCQVRANFTRALHQNALPNESDWFDAFLCAQAQPRTSCSSL